MGWAAGLRAGSEIAGGAIDAYTAAKEARTKREYDAAMAELKKKQRIWEEAQQSPVEQSPATGLGAPGSYADKLKGMADGGIGPNGEAPQMSPAASSAKPTPSRVQQMLGQAPEGSQGYYRDMTEVERLREQAALATKHGYDDKAWRFEETARGLTRQEELDQRYIDELKYARSQDALQQENWQTTFDESARRWGIENARAKLNADLQNKLTQLQIDGEGRRGKIEQRVMGINDAFFGALGGDEGSLVELLKAGMPAYNDPNVTDDNNTMKLGADGRPVVVTPDGEELDAVEYFKGQDKQSQMYLLSMAQTYAIGVATGKPQDYINLVNESYAQGTDRLNAWSAVQRAKNAAKGDSLKAWEQFDADIANGKVPSMGTFMEVMGSEIPDMKDPTEYYQEFARAQEQMFLEAGANTDRPGPLPNGEGEPGSTEVGLKYDPDPASTIAAEQSEKERQKSLVAQADQLLSQIQDPDTSYEEAAKIIEANKALFEEATKYTWLLNYNRAINAVMEQREKQIRYGGGLQ